MYINLSILILCNSECRNNRVEVWDMEREVKLNSLEIDRPGFCRMSVLTSDGKLTSGAYAGWKIKTKLLIIWLAFFSDWPPDI